jgi:hypothetical protein
VNAAAEQLESTNPKVACPLYSLRPKISAAFTFRKTTLTKYILKNINNYDT